MSTVPMKALLEAGVHFGHRTRRWNPKMKPYIFTERNGIHIIDLQQTITRLNHAYDLVKDTVASGGLVLFVGTKRQAQESVAQEAQRASMPYVEQRWLGGTLTNWRTIRQRIDYLLDIEKQQARGEFSRLVKKEALLREREIARLNQRLGGLKEMRRLPSLLFVVDVRRDDLAVKEANTLGIPVIAMVDTNCDPDPIDYVIPSNDDAIRAVKLIISTIATAALEGRALRSSLEAEEEEAAGMEGEEAMERYLGPSTLAKIRAAAVDEDELSYDEVEDALEEVEIEALNEATEAEEEVESEAPAEPVEMAAEPEPEVEVASEVSAEPVEMAAEPEPEVEVASEVPAEQPVEMVAEPEPEVEVASEVPAEQPVEMVAEPEPEEVETLDAEEEKVQE